MRSVPSAVADGFSDCQWRNPSATADGTDLIATAGLLIQNCITVLNQLAQQLKGVRPFVAQEAGNAPQYRQ